MDTLTLNEILIRRLWHTKNEAHDVYLRLNNADELFILISLVEGSYGCRCMEFKISYVYVS